jgi:hypothetical protein
MMPHSVLAHQLLVLARGDVRALMVCTCTSMAQVLANASAGGFSVFQVMSEPKEYIVVYLFI